MRPHYKPQTRNTWCPLQQPYTIMLTRTDKQINYVKMALLYTKQVGITLMKLSPILEVIILILVRYQMF